MVIKSQGKCRYRMRSSNLDKAVNAEGTADERYRHSTFSVDGMLVIIILITYVKRLAMSQQGFLFHFIYSRN